MLVWYEIVLRLFLACVFGALIGLERERKDRAAGIRTHMMVCLGSALIMLVSEFGFSDVLGMDKVALDPSRVAAQVVSGIGFIGAGTILFLKQGTIKGLTTAAGLWTVAAIGLATGGGMYFPAGIATVLALGILWAVQPFERMYLKKFRRETLRIVTGPDVDQSQLLNDFVNGKENALHSFSMDRNANELVFQLQFDKQDAARLREIITTLKNMPGVKEVSWSQ